MLLKRGSNSSNLSSIQDNSMTQIRIIRSILDKFRQVEARRQNFHIVNITKQRQRQKFENNFGN